VKTAFAYIADTRAKPAASLDPTQFITVQESSSSSLVAMKTDKLIYNSDGFTLAL